MKELLERFLQDSENIWKLFTHMTDGLMITNDKKNLIVTNPAFEQMTGYCFDEVRNKNPKLLKSDKNSRTLYDSMWDSLDSQGTWCGELINKRKDGEEIWVYLSITYIKKKKKQDSYYIGLMRDITAKKRNEQQIEFLAFHDTLTKLPNRAKFMQTLQSTLQSSSRLHNMFSILFIDLDRFKIINDTFGHHAGDMLLIEVANRLQDIIGDKGLVCRFGGDEFTVILHDITSKEEVHAIIERIFQCFERPIDYHQEKLMITTSIGVSFYPDHGTDIQTLLRKADSAMYRTKDEGKNNFSVYNQELPDEQKDNFRLEQELIQSIERNELEIYYQLQVDVTTASPYGAEALVRWNHRVKGLLSPAIFLPLAEEIGYIVQMDDWVMKNALIQAKKWHNLGHDKLVISINISKKQFEQDDFIEKVSRYITETEINPQLVCLEITENIAMLNIDTAVEKLRQLKDMGVYVSLDDFGTGYSSLSRLKNFPIDVLKIDQSFVRGTKEVDKNNAIVKLIIAMAKSLNFRVICEGIETVEQLSFIRKEGCDTAQGYLFSEPIPGQICEALLEQMYRAVQADNTAAATE